MQLESISQVRRRGVILTVLGLKKLNQAKAEAENALKFGRYTLESLSEKTGLTSTTLSKVFTGSAGVDKRTLKRCFNTFNITLLAEDYKYLNSNPVDNLAQISFLRSGENFCDLKAVCDSQHQKFGNDYSNTRQASHMPQSPSPPSVPGGQIPSDSVFYVDRPILESLCYEAIVEPGAMVNIRAPKQMGKTSLISRILTYGRSLGYQVVSLNLQLVDDEILHNLESFLKWFCTRISKQLGFAYQAANFRFECLGSKSNATDYFEDIILAKCDRPIIVAIDELNQLFAYPDIAREFLLLLRTWSELAKAKVTDTNPWHKLRLVTVHSTEILMPSRIDPSLFNTGLVIKLPELTPVQVQDLAQRWEQKITEQEIEQLIILLGGHPYRLQLAFYYLHKQVITLKKLLANSKNALAIYLEHLEYRWWNLQHYPELLPLFRKVVTQLNPVDCEGEQCSQLEQMGLVHVQGFEVSLVCELFRPFFRKRLINRNDRNWHIFS